MWDYMKRSNAYVISNPGEQKKSMGLKKYSNK